MTPEEPKVKKVMTTTDNKNKIEIPATAPVDPLVYQSRIAGSPKFLPAVESEGPKTLRKAALETLLSGSMFLADIKGGHFKDPVEQRFLAALEALREALA